MLGCKTWRFGGRVPTGAFSQVPLAKVLSDITFYTFIACTWSDVHLHRHIHLAFCVVLANFWHLESVTL